MVRMMPGLPSALTGAAATAAAIFWLPWSYYGMITIGLTRLPGWHFYVVAAAALHVLVGYALLVGRRGRYLLTVGTVLAVVTAAAAVTVMEQYDNTRAIFGPGAIVPAILPNRGPGGFAAVLGAVLTWLALARAPGRWRRARSARGRWSGAGAGRPGV